MRKPDDPEPSYNVIETVADAEETEPTELSPSLYDTIDPEALDRLTTSMGDEGQVTFEYKGYNIGVFGDGSAVILDDE